MLLEPAVPGPGLLPGDIPEGDLRSALQVAQQEAKADREP